MEQEFKWKADTALHQAVLLWASNRPDTISETIRMQSNYFDTTEGDLHREGTALRLRQENEHTVCCLKRRNVSEENGLRSHEEYETEAATLTDGLAGLRAAHAPAAVCDWLMALPLSVHCTVNFTRIALTLTQDNTVCELALDEGTLAHEGRTAPLCEIELELKRGEEIVFRALAAELADRFALVPEPQSKLQRAFAL